MNDFKSVKIISAFSDNIHPLANRYIRYINGKQRGENWYPRSHLMTAAKLKSRLIISVSINNDKCWISRIAGGRKYNWNEWYYYGIMAPVSRWKLTRWCFEKFPDVDDTFYEHWNNFEGRIFYILAISLISVLNNRHERFINFVKD